MDFLVIGAGRGGTSLLMSLLDAHPQLELGYESHAIDCLMGLGLHVAADSIKPMLAEARAREFLRRCREDAARFPGKRWGNKITTEQLQGLDDHNQVNAPIDTLDIFFRKVLTFETPVVFILRDGRACVKSKVKRTGQPPELAAVRWKYSIAVKDYLVEHHPNALVVKFEDLVARPEAVLSDLCDFLGVDFDPVMLSGTDNKKVRPEYRTDRIRKDRAATRDVPRAVLPLIARPLLETGYIGPWTFRLYQLYGRPRLLLLIITLLATALAAGLGVVAAS